jgi:hypothetical protein
MRHWHHIDRRFDSVQVSGNADVVCERSGGSHAKSIDRFNDRSVARGVVNKPFRMLHIIVAARTN